MLKTAVQLKMSFDAEKLQKDFRKLEGERRVPQTGQYHNGEWTGLSLYSADGLTETTSPDPQVGPFLPTQALSRVPYLKSVLDLLPFPKFSVRLMSLPPGGQILQHRDEYCDFRIGRIRLQIPIVNDPDMIFQIGNESHSWKPGELWHADVSIPHSVTNQSPSVTRVNMLIDAGISPGLLELFPESYIQKKMKTGIAPHLSYAEIPENTLARYQCRLRFPIPVPLIHRNRHYRRLGLTAEIRLVSGRLLMLIDGTPRYSLQSAGPQTHLFFFDGMPSGASIQFGMRGKTVSTAIYSLYTLNLEPNGQSSPLDLIVPLTVESI